MSGKGECLDNAVAESFFGTLKAELLADQPERRFASKCRVPPHTERQEAKKQNIR